MIDYCCLLRLWMASRRQVWCIYLSGPDWSTGLISLPRPLGLHSMTPALGRGCVLQLQGYPRPLSCRVLLQATHVPTSVCVSACLCVWGAGFAGTPGYLSPEVLRKDPYGKPVDLWACGESIQRPDCHWDPEVPLHSPDSPVSLPLSCSSPQGSSCTSCWLGTPHSGTRTSTACTSRSRLAPMM